jgi:hypothetical protein
MPHHGWTVDVREASRLVEETYDRLESSTRKVK